MVVFLGQWKENDFRWSRSIWSLGQGKYIYNSFYLVFSSFILFLFFCDFLFHNILLIYLMHWYNLLISIYYVFYMPKYHLCIPIFQTSTIPNNLCLNLVAIKKKWQSNSKYFKFRPYSTLGKYRKTSFLETWLVIVI